MKTMKKFASLALALVLALALAIPAMAQTVGDENEATITIENAAKGETYSIYKIFGATVSEAENNNTSKSIAYTGEIPEALKDIFSKNTTTGAITVAEDVSEDQVVKALKDYVENENVQPTASEEADGTELVFNVEYGYYVVTSTVGNGATITVTSTHPNASVYDKNSAGTPYFPEDPDGDQGKVLKDGNTATIGSTVTYIVKFNTVNYIGAGEDADKVTEYTITDTLPEFLANVEVTEITIDGNPYTVDNKTPQFTNKSITFDWINENGESLYNSGAQIQITYTATVTGSATIGTANKNTVTASWKTENNNTPDNPPSTDEDLYTYSFELVKHNSDNDTLEGAVFSLFTTKTDGTAVQLIKVSENVYRVATEEEIAAAEDDDTIEIVTTVTTPEDGKITIQGLGNGTYYMEEVTAPNGYNKLAERAEVTINNANIETSLDTDNKWTGFDVLNQTGSTLPSTGGMGTTIFYVVGGVLVLGAAVLLITKKRTGSAN